MRGRWPALQISQAAAQSASIADPDINYSSNLRRGTNDALSPVRKEKENVMNIKNLIAALATITTVATSTAAMADVRYTGDVGFTAQGGVTVRDRSVPPMSVQQPVIMHNRNPSQRWETQYQQPAPVVIAPQPDYIRCNDNAWTSVARANVTGTVDQWGSTKTIRLGGYRNIGEMTFGWVYGNQSIEDVTVTYMNGTQARFHLGDTVTQNPLNATTRTIALNRNLAIRNIQISGFGDQTGVFTILAKA